MVELRDIGMTPKALRPVRREMVLARVGGLWVISSVAARIPSRALRHVIYRHVLRLDFDVTAKIHKGLEIISASKVHIGPGTIIGQDALLDGRESIRFGSNVNLGGEVAIFTLQHDVRSSTFAAVGGPVTVGDRAWLSFRTTILPGVTIGEGAVVAAGAVVTKDVPPYTIVAGIPAKVIGNRPQDLTYDFSHNRAPWFV
jgi:acetyltransferase-like isoleucine patch superfamily enzyme